VRASRGLPVDKHRFHRRIRQHLLAREHRFFAVVQPGFEEACGRELAEIGAGTVAGITEGGVEFLSRLNGCYAANYFSRAASRILMRLARFRARRFDELRRRIEEFPWELYINEGTHLEIHATSSGSALYHTGRIRDEFLAGIAARFGRYGMIASSDAAAAQTVSVRIQGDRCTMSLDASGELLYRRQERVYVTAAPLRETLASLILMEAGAGDYDCIIDPMCGSGTFSLEGASMLMGLAPGRHRGFAFMNWPCFSRPAFDQMVKRHEAALSSRARGFQDSPVPFVFASDIDTVAIDAARSNIERAGLGGAVDLRRHDFLGAPVALPGERRCLIALNPPYGARYDVDSGSLYRMIGRRVREWYGRCGYAIVTPSLEHEKILSLPYDKKVLFWNGGIKVALIVKAGSISR
jgi:putative N6-adenine-specific DNA methylase